LSEEQVLNTLANLGFDEVDAKIYVFLAKKGTKKANAICNALKLTKQQLYPSLKRLQRKGIVTSTFEHPAMFQVLSFEKVLDLFIKAKIEETRSLQQSKAQILADWANLKLEDSTSEKFSVLEGRNVIFSKIHQVIQTAKSHILAITTVPTLFQANQRDLFETETSQSEVKVPFRFLAKITDENARVMNDLLKDGAKVRFSFEGRSPDLGQTLFPQMLIRDGEEALFFVKPRTEMSIVEKEDVCLWTDCGTLVQALTAIFETLWLNSTSIEDRISELETGKLTPKTSILKDAEEAKKKYSELAKSAKESIFIMTSSDGFSELSESVSQLNEWVQRGVTVRVMAPIMTKNLQVAQSFSKLGTVKHVAPNDVETTIIDKKHLFHFQVPSAEAGSTDLRNRFKNTFYTNNAEYIQKTVKMLHEVWKHSNSPSAENLEKLFGTGARVQSSAYFPGAIRSPGPHGMFYPLPPAPAAKGKYPVVRIINDDPTKKLTEQDVLNEFLSLKKKSSENQWNIYSSQAIAIIHTPDYFNLPPMLLRAHHVEERSTGGAENIIMVNLWLELPSGHAYIPVAVLGDNSKTQSWWRKHFAGSPAATNVQLTEKGELQISVHANTLFAGWTVPIQLYPSQFVLPPACMLIEGYGDVKTAVYTIAGPTGGLTAKQNGFDAFVTFMHSSSEYCGAGTDGFFVRDFVGNVSRDIFKGNQPRTLETIHTQEEKRT
jgi:HTH-type transcriptional regulator, sugar sensing transcriptional regulator